jgi:hypothetical protein
MTSKSWYRHDTPSHILMTFSDNLSGDEDDYGGVSLPDDRELDGQPVSYMETTD